MKSIMILHVNCTLTQDVVSEGVTYRQILFDGSVEGDFFNGEILPGGVDTQVGYADGSGMLSARYMLKGTDYTGAEARIYVENTAAFGSQTTSPVLHADSPALAFLHTAKLVGQMHFLENDFQIEILMEDA